jgi:hypothetical protein
MRCSSSKYRVRLLAIDAASSLRGYTPTLLNRQGCSALRGLDFGSVRNCYEEQEGDAWLTSGLYAALPGNAKY